MLHFPSYPSLVFPYGNFGFGPIIPCFSKNLNLERIEINKAAKTIETAATANVMKFNILKTLKRRVERLNQYKKLTAEKLQFVETELVHQI